MLVVCLNDAHVALQNEAQSIQKLAVWNCESGRVTRATSTTSLQVGRIECGVCEGGEGIQNVSKSPEPFFSPALPPDPLETVDSNRHCMQAIEAWTEPVLRIVANQLEDVSGEHTGCLRWQFMMQSRACG